MRDERKRMIFVNTNGPSLDTVVGPSSRLVDEENRLPGYRPMKYIEYLECQVKHVTAGTHPFDEVQIHI